MRYFMILAENVGVADKAAICAKMVDAEIEGTYWDDRARAAYPGQFNGSDNAANMIQDWRHGRFAPFPEKFQNMDDVDIQDTPEFRAIIEKWASERYDQVVEKLNQIRKIGDQYLVHRVIKVPENWFAKIKRQTSLGLHWTFDFDGWNSEIGAYAVWAHDKPGVELIFEALVNSTHVDWEYTILANMDWYSGDHEYELRLKKGAPLKVLSCKNLETEQELAISGITFTA